MLRLEIPQRELWDEQNQVFVYTKPYKLKLEHSLLSISRWESEWKKPFLKNLPKLTQKELASYVQCMSFQPDSVRLNEIFIGPEEANQIYEYINDPMTATTIKSKSRQQPQKRGSDVTSELVYFWMIEYGVPFECDKWNFNRLMTLIHVAQVKGKKSDKLGKHEAAEQRKAMNEARRAKMHSKG